MRTECPECKTQFNFSLEVLKASKGKVRCGKCFHIFTAADHLVLADEKTQKKKVDNKFEFSQTAIDNSSAEGSITQLGITNVNTFGEIGAVGRKKAEAEPEPPSLTDIDDDALIMDTQETPIIRLDD